ncbi:putative SWEET sugar transporter [Rosa chinensis]|uniref:Bidirectional sugar transporter SWEET n=1 Tax=Rosa chinensis TaxID=74649 RepID=A0A2P6PWG0_ROSCH|nr:bidirectional sugar transporter SWEET14 [Rosa chinensis]PRQ26268.1 putative SWEET sugar transporter [Rosa chinensis]
MAALDLHLMASVFGILGTIFAFLVYLAPLPTFYRIFKTKSVQGFQSIPYSVALFSAMLMLYYGFLKTHALILIVVNSTGSFIETVYLVMYLIYAPPKVRIFTVKLLVLFNVLAYGLILGGTSQISNASRRLTVVGYINVVFNVSVYAAPLSIMRLVIKTKSVEYMSFSLSLCLTLLAVVWFFYGLLIEDLFIAAPNILGFAFGIAQMIMFLVYKKKKKVALPECSLNDQIPNTDRVATVENYDIVTAGETNTQTQLEVGDKEEFRS